MLYNLLCSPLQTTYIIKRRINNWWYDISLLSSTVKGFLQNIRDVFEAGIFIIFLREGNVGIPEKRKKYKKITVDNNYLLNGTQLLADLIKSLSKKY